MIYNGNIRHKLNKISQNKSFKVDRMYLVLEVIKKKINKRKDVINIIYLIISNSIRLMFKFIKKNVIYIVKR